MSMTRCERCERIFDSDEDPDCFVEKPTHTSYECICESCRDEIWEENEKPWLG